MTKRSLFYLLYNNCMLSVLNEAILMCTHKIPFMIKENFPKISINIWFLGLSREFPRDSKKSSN